MALITHGIAPRNMEACKQLNAEAGPKGFTEPVPCVDRRHIRYGLANALYFAEVMSQLLSDLARRLRLTLGLANDPFRASSER